MISPDRRDKIAQALHQAQELKLKLDALDDELLTKIPLVEAALKNLSLGVRLSTLISEEQESPGLVACSYLVYGKHENRWQLLIESNYNGDPNSSSEMPLKNASREERLWVFKHHLSELIEGAVQQLATQIEYRNEALKATDELLGVLGAVASPKNKKTKAEQESSSLIEKAVK